MSPPAPRNRRQRLLRHAFAAYVSAGAARARLAAARLRHPVRPRLTYFHEVGDPYSALVAQRLPALADRYGATLEVELVGPPSDAAAPARELLDAYARVDATRLARVWALDFVEDPRPPRPETIEAASRYVIGGADGATRLARIDRVRDAVHRDDLAAIERLPGARASAQTTRRAIEAGERARAEAGHYLGGVIHDGAEVYWGVDRLDHLERALGGEPSPDLGPSPLASDPDAPVDVFFSFRSPYSYLAIERIRRGRRPERWRLRPVLPMVMRGLAVPREKRRYILRDAAREARRRDIPFGFGVDPLGAGVERCVAVFEAAAREGRGLELAASAYRAIFAEGVDVAEDEGLRYVARRAGLDDALLRRALEDETWRETVERNRARLFELGLWGVPTFERGGEALWGQDRLTWLDPTL